jgi:hypothetical protein
MSDEGFTRVRHERKELINSSLLTSEQAERIYKNADRYANIASGIIRKETLKDYRLYDRRITR